MNRLQNKLSFPETLDGHFFNKVFEVFSGNKTFYIKLILLTGFIFAIVSLFISSRFEVDIDANFDENMSFLAVLGTQVLQIGTRLIIKLILLVPQAYFLVYFISSLPEMYEGHDIDFSGIKNVNLYLVAKFFGFISVVFLLESIAFLLFAIPALFVAIYFAFTQFVIVLEDAVNNTFERALKLVSGFQTKVFSLYLLYFFILLLQFVVGVIVTDFEIGNMQESEVPASPFNVSEFGVSFLIGTMSAFSLYFLTQCCFQLYMMSRIRAGEIEVVNE